MSEIKSSLTAAEQLTGKLQEACDEIQHTSQLFAIGEFSTVVPAQEMKKAFSNSLLYTEQYANHLQESIEKIRATATSFSEQDQALASETPRMK
ncbi:TIGR04197 family type VII secretion effector [Listeria kieliensis]|nr:TIGR04197 family type VII secretion effector [Listeria kieliensis]